MKNELVMNILKKADEHLPGILVVGGIIVGVTTVAYSVYAGWKIKEIASDEELEVKEKAKKIALISAPAVIGCVAASACEVCAHKEQTKRYAALGTLIAASKAESLVGKEKVDEIKEAVTGKKSSGKPEKAHYPEGVKPGDVIRIHDDETGFEFNTTLVDFMTAVTEFNSQNLNMIQPTIADFYELLLGEDGYDHCSAHEHIMFGVRFNDEIIAFAPQFEGGLTDDMKLIYRISYDYINK